MATWLEDRKALKLMARHENACDVGMPGRMTQRCRTLVYACIAQMRGKLHMKSYRKKTGGWWSIASKEGRREIRHLADQREWIWWALGQCNLTTEGCALIDIAGRVFYEGWEPAKPWIRVVSEQPRFPSDAVLASVPIGNAEAKC